MRQSRLRGQIEHHFSSVLPHVIQRLNNQRLELMPGASAFLSHLHDCRFLHEDAYA